MAARNSLSEGGATSRPAADPSACLAPICPNPVFIIGSPRSGTTVLARSLAQHSEFWTSGESYVLFHLFGSGLAGRAFDRAMEVPGPRFLRREEVSRDEFLAYVGTGINALMTGRSGGRRWIDHTPHYTLIVDTLAKVFAGAKFVHILRDGREVVNSMLNFRNSHPDPAVARFAQRTMAWSRDMRSACDTWREHVEAAMAFLDEHPDRATVVRYDDLVAAPEATFRRIHGFLEVEDEPSPARFLTSRRINSSFSGRRSLSADELWERWDDGERGIFTEVAGPMMLRCRFLTPDALRSPPGVRVRE